MTGLKYYDAKPTIGAFQAGVADQNAAHDRGVLRDIGQSTSQGGYLQGAKTAMTHGRMDFASKLQAMGHDEQIRLFDTLSRHAYAADTPEKWSAMTRRMSEKFGPDSIKGYEDFSRRQDAIELALSASDRIKLEAMRNRGSGPTALQKNLASAGIVPGTPEYKAVVLGNATKPATNVNFHSEKEYSKSMGKHIANARMKHIDASNAARKLMGNYSKAAALLGDKNVYTGTGAAQIEWIKKAGSTLFGMNFKGVPEATAAAKLRGEALGMVREMVGDKRMSDADRKVYMEMMPNMTDDPEGIQLTVEFAREAAEAAFRAEQALSTFINDLGPDKGYEAYRAWSGNQRIWSSDVIARARANAKKKSKKRGPGAGSGEVLKKLYESYGEPE